MKNQSGFTILELLVIIVLLGVIGSVFWVQKNNIEVARRDDTRKSTINMLYYGIEEVYYPNHNKRYPKSLSEKTLPAIDKSLFTDPTGAALGSGQSDYRYEGKDCTNDSCAAYSLRANLENEADFVKTNRQTSS